MSESSNNIVSFPRRHSARENTNQKLEDIQYNVDSMRHYHIQETISHLTPIIFNQLDIAGFGLSDDEEDDIKDGALIVEALRSYMLKYYAMYHPFQIIADNVFISDEKDPEGSLRIANTLNLELKNTEE